MNYAIYNIPCLHLPGWLPWLGRPTRLVAHWVRFVMGGAGCRTPPPPSLPGGHPGGADTFTSRTAGGLTAWPVRAACKRWSSCSALYKLRSMATSYRDNLPRVSVSLVAWVKAIASISPLRAVSAFSAYCKAAARCF